MLYDNKLSVPGQSTSGVHHPPRLRSHHRLSVFTGDTDPLPGTIVCNVGDMLQRLSNAHYPSTTHRVVNPRGEKARVSRYSIPFFVHPNPEMSLDALPQCVDDNHPKLHPAITAGEYLQQRLRDIGLIK